MKKSQKHTVRLVALIAVALGAVVLLMPGMYPSLSAWLRGEQTWCTDTPYNPICICTLDKEKTWYGSQYACISHSPKATTDCDWCNGRCVEWRKVWDEHPSSEEYNEYCSDRAPKMGYSCVAQASPITGTLECVDIPAVHTEGIKAFCSDEALREFIAEFPGSDTEIVSFFRSSCPVPGVNPYDNCELGFGGGSGVGKDNSNNRLSMVECRSTCYDQTGTPTGGRIVWSAMWYTETKDIISADGGWVDENCIQGI